MFFKDSIVKINIFYVFVKVDNLTDPDTNCGLDPDPNTVFLDPPQLQSQVDIVCLDSVGPAAEGGGEPEEEGGLERIFVLYYLLFPRGQLLLDTRGLLESYILL